MNLRPMIMNVLRTERDNRKYCKVQCNRMHLCYCDYSCGCVIVNSDLNVRKPGKCLAYFKRLKNCPIQGIQENV